jgi:hypothetical protein
MQHGRPCSTLFLHTHCVHISPDSGSAGLQNSITAISFAFDLILCASGYDFAGAGMCFV